MYIRKGSPLKRIRLFPAVSFAYRRSSAERKPLTQVDSPDLRIGAQFLGRAVAKDLALVDDVRAVGDRECFTDIMVRNQHSDATGFKVEDDFLKVDYRDGIDSRKGLIQKNEGWLDAQAAGNLDASPFATGKRIAAGLADVAQVQLFDQLFGTGAPGLAGNVLDLQHRQNVFLDRKLAEDRWLLRQIADAVMAGPHVHRDAGDVFSIGEDTAGIRRDQTDDHVKAGCLSGAVRAQKTDHFSLAHVNADAADYLTPLV